MTRGLFLYRRARALKPSACTEIHLHRRDVNADKRTALGRDTMTARMTAVPHTSPAVDNKDPMAPAQKTSALVVPREAAETKAHAPYQTSGCATTTISNKQTRPRKCRAHLLESAKHRDFGRNAANLDDGRLEKIRRTTQRCAEGTIVFLALTMSQVAAVAATTAATVPAPSSAEYLLLAEVAELAELRRETSPTSPDEPSAAVEAD
ncbi:hypothetical protein HPB47_019917 [Ixodes persulcatus]|uniref:Uncharacterized protein n=1 Tax=Ixodes persulcatus TaxID=34615 RepID=A0AC60QGU8_IXOPE|nr:hypothetical protein HPB47_019917 [Ixodes persulcatus]